MEQITEKLNEVSLGEYNCSVCLERFDTHDSYLEHRTHCNKPTHNICKYCNVYIQNTDSLKEHEKICSCNQFKYPCPYNCGTNFKSTVEISHHTKICSKKPTSNKCYWYTSKGRRCRNKGTNNGYCFCHSIDYTYDPNGLKDEEGNIEPCSCTYDEPYVPNDIKILNNMFVYNLTFRHKSKKYVIEKVYDTYAIFKTLGLIEEKITVWNSTEDRKGKKGPIINKFTASMEIECENRASVCVDGVFMCEGCFEREFNTTTKSLR